ncbi:MAG: FUSC family protein [Deltaproteobacteria bacterium]|nr:FUSC family protein [Deltaproteobacteria bacterium]
MAQAVQHSPLFGSTFARVARVSPATAFALRYATAVSAAIWIGHAPGLVTNQSQWILITVLMVMQPMAGGSLFKGFLRAVGTSAAFFTAILLFGLYAQDPPLLLASLFLVQAVAAYGWTGSRYQYAWFVWAFTTAIVLGDAMAGADDVETLAFERASMVGIGILIVCTVDSLLWSPRSEPSLRHSLAESARQLAGALRRAVEAPSGVHTKGEKSASSPLVAQLGMIDSVRTEVGVSQARVTTLTQIALLLEAAASRMRILRLPLDVEAGSIPTPIAAALSELGRCVESALDEVADALATNRSPSPFAAGVEHAVSAVEAESERLRERAGARAAFEGRVAGLRDLVAPLRTLEEDLVRLQLETSRDLSLVLPPAPAARGFRMDPFRVQIALRTAIAVCGAFVVPMVLGWEINTMVAPMAFMVAAMPTRGGVTQSVGLLAGIVLFGWLLSDLALVFVIPHAGRLPLGLVYPAAIAGVFAYVAAVHPQLAMLPSIGGLVAILPIFSGLAAPTDVYGTYNTISYIAVGLGVGWLATRLLWPATATRLFRERVAVQLEGCRGALRERDTAAVPVERRQLAAAFLADYARQLAQLGSLHNQARHEPVEHALDDERRGELLALAQDLFDVVLAAHVRAPNQTPALLARGGEEFADLREALARLDDALLASLETAAESLRVDAAPPGPDLAEARDAVEERLDEIRAGPELRLSLDAQEREAFLVHLDSRRQLATRQLAIERWLAG